LSEWQKERLGSMLYDRQIGSRHAQTFVGEDKPSKSTKVPKVQRDSLDAYLGGVYDNTQDYYKERGIDTVTVYRGVGALKADKYAKGEKVQLKSSNALESWTTNKGVARAWGTMVQADVPVDRILGMSTTGIGTVDEYEVVVIGNMEGDIVEIVK